MEAVSNNKKSAIETMFNYQVCDLGSDITSGIAFYRVTFNIKNPRFAANYPKKTVLQIYIIFALIVA